MPSCFPAGLNEVQGAAKENRSVDGISAAARPLTFWKKIFGEQVCLRIASHAVSLSLQNMFSCVYLPTGSLERTFLSAMLNVPMPLKSEPTRITLAATRA